MPSHPEQLMTRGNRIVSAVSGRPVLLRGVNLSGLEYGGHRPDWLTRETLEAIHVEWQANIIRLPINQEWALHGGSGFTAEEYGGALDAVIGWAAEFGAYTLLDLQWLDARTPRGTLANGSVNYVPALPDQESIRLWRALAGRYREEPAVLFDLFNEPHDPLTGDTTPLLWPDGQAVRQGRVTANVWNAWAGVLADAVREVHPSSVVFAGGTNWSYDLRDVSLAERPNLVYSTHIYPGKRPSWRRAFGQFANQVPVFAGEWGFEASQLGWGEELAAYLRELGIGWTAWSWHDRPHLLTADGRTPTAFGELVRRELAT